MIQAPTPAAVGAAREALARIDPALARAHAQTPAFEWRLRPGGYEGLFRMIVEQQVSVAAAASIWKRTVEGLGGGVTPDAVLALDVETLRSFGLSGQKAAYGREIALAQAEGRIDLEHMGTLGDAEATAALTAIKGVGRWTAETYLMFCEGRLDVFPAATWPCRRRCAGPTGPCCAQPRNRPMSGPRRGGRTGAWRRICCGAGTAGSGAARSCWRRR